MTPGPSFPAFHSPLHFINRYPWKLLQHYITTTLMALFKRAPFMLLFHQSKCISAVQRVLFYYRHIYTLVFVHVFVCCLLLPIMLISTALRLRVKTLYNIIQLTFVAEYIVRHSVRTLPQAIAELRFKIFLFNALSFLRAWNVKRCSRIRKS